MAKDKRNARGEPEGGGPERLLPAPVAHPAGPAGAGGEVARRPDDGQVAIDEVAARVRAIELGLSRMRAIHPGVNSYDPNDMACQHMDWRLRTEAGLPASVRNGWRGKVVAWRVGIWVTKEDYEEGVATVLPCVTFMSDRSEVLRFCGRPAVSCWARIVSNMPNDFDGSSIGIVAYRQPGQGDHSYWQFALSSPEKKGT